MLTNVSPWITTPLGVILLYLFLRFLFWAFESGFIWFIFIAGFVVTLLAKGAPLIGMMQ